jgi:hypothetical protein
MSKKRAGLESTNLYRQIGYYSAEFVERTFHRFQFNFELVFVTLVPPYVCVRGAKTAESLFVMNEMKETAPILTFLFVKTRQTKPIRFL